MENYNLRIPCLIPIPRRRRIRWSFHRWRSCAFPCTCILFPFHRRFLIPDEGTWVMRLRFHLCSSTITFNTTFYTTLTRPRPRRTASASLWWRIRRWWLIRWICSFWSYWSTISICNTCSCSRLLTTSFITSSKTWIPLTRLKLFRSEAPFCAPFPPRFCVLSLRHLYYVIFVESV